MKNDAIISITFCCGARRMATIILNKQCVGAREIDKTMHHFFTSIVLPSDQNYKYQLRRYIS